MAFTFKTYSESDAVKKKAAELANHNANKVADWTGGAYGSALNEALNKIQNRQKFSYDLNADALYQQYKDQYVNQGKLAMQDTLGQASALTGGYGNSYAATAGNQAYQGYLQQLNNKVPELYQMALNQYNQEGANLKDQYAMLSDRYNQEYGEHQDRVARWNADRDYLSNDYNNERSYDYGRYSDDRSNAFSSYQQQVAEDQWNRNYQEQIRQYNENLAYQKARDAIADQQWQKQYNLSLANSKKSSGGGSGSKSSGKSPTEAILDTAIDYYTKYGDEKLASYVDKMEAAGYNGDAILSHVVNNYRSASANKAIIGDTIKSMTAQTKPIAKLIGSK